MTIVGRALDYMQRDTSCFSKVYATWLRLVQSKELDQYKATIESRFNEAMQPFHALAYMTDPTLLEKVPIPKDQEDAAYKWLEEEYPQFLPGVLYYNIKDQDTFPTGMFADITLKDTQMTASKWWKMMKTKFENDLRRCEPEEKKKIAQYQALVDFCTFLMKLHSCPASSASIERTFSTFGLIWSKLRNKLESDKVTKLVKVHRYLNRQEDGDW